MFSKATSKFRSKPTSNGNGHADPQVSVDDARNAEDKRPRIKEEVKDLLLKNGVPLVSCRDACSDPCSDDESLDYHFDPKTITAWKKQDIEFSSDLLGSTKPFLRHCLISTGKKDWIREVSDLDGSLAQHLGKLNESASTSNSLKKVEKQISNENEEEKELPTGCWQTLRSTKGTNSASNQTQVTTKLNFTNSSHLSNSSLEENQSIMLFPDYLLLTEVPQLSSLDPKAASKERKESVETRIKDTFERYISPSADAKRQELNLAIPRTRRWVLPYKAVILLCSHKKRDVRCHLAAPLLAAAFRAHAESAGWEVDERGDDVASHHFSPSQNSTGEKTEDGLTKGFGFGYVEESSDEDLNQEQILNWRKRAHLGLDENAALPTGEENESERAGKLGVFYCSHIGGHKFSGNVIIYFPNGAGVWLGRVDPLKDAGAVFEQTIQKGIVIEEFLRAGINLKRDGSDVKRSGTASELKASAGGNGILRW